MGGLDAAQGLLPGQDRAQLRAQTDEAGNQLGTAGSMSADLAGYAMAPGKIGSGLVKLGGIGERMIPRILASGAEGGVTSGASSLLHGNDLSTAGKDAAIGTAIGLGTGILPGGGAKPKTPSTDDLEAASKAAYAAIPAKNYKPSGVIKTIDNVTANVPKGLDVNMGDTLGTQIAKLTRVSGKGGPVTADDIAGYQRSLRYAARGDTDQKIANRYIDTLNTAVGPQVAGSIKDANAAHNIFKTSGEIDDWIANPLTAPKQIAKALEDQPHLYRSQPGLFEGLSAIAKKADPSVASDVGKEITKRLVGAAIGGGTSMMMGGDLTSGSGRGR